MSGLIYGRIALNQATLPTHINMQEQLRCYKLDRYMEVKEKSAFMGCGLLHITPQNQTEKLPLYNKSQTRLITADVILDNRQELYETFGLNLSEAISDSELILYAYEKWGRACPNHLVGDFAFVIWDKAKNEIFAARDATGTRTFYYTFQEGIFYFGSVIKAIQNLNKTSQTLNSKWIAQFLSNETPLIQFDSESTPYNEIKQLPPAHSLHICHNKMQFVKYWQPLQTVKPLKLANDEAYREAFLKLFKEAVNCRLTDANGIFLSGGLDSSSVACFAATTLQKDNQTLEAFSSVPMTQFEPYYIPGRQADESEYITALVKMYPNIHLNYCRAEGKTAISDLEHVLEVFEYPYKMVENITWYREGVEKAKQCGCKVLLNGQFGNTTISYGNFLTQSLTLMHHWQWRKLLKEMKAFSNTYHIPRKVVLKKVISIAIPYRLKKLLRYKQARRFDYFEYSLLNKAAIEKFKLKKTLESIHYYQYPKYFMDLKEERQSIMDAINFTQIASMEMKLGLEQGILIRDPTRDKRLIEFCLSLPGEQFVKDGIERRLICYSMQGLLPECILTNITNRGIQGADKLQRLKAVWPNLYKTFEKINLNTHLVTMIDFSKYHAHLTRLNKTLVEEDWSEIKVYLLLYICNQFLEM